MTDARAGEASEQGGSEAGEANLAAARPEQPDVRATRFERADDVLDVRATRVEGGMHLHTAGSAARRWTRANLPPGILHRYEALEDIRAGAQGTVIQARRLEDGEIVAIKVSSPGVSVDHAVLDRLQRLPKDHVVVIHEHGRTDGCDWEVMEYVAGGSLAALLLQEGPQLGSPRVREILDELASALGALHGERPQIVHRDLKPENVLVRSSQPLDLVLTDFGTTRSIDGTSVISTRIATLPYAAPEALAGHASPARDWWALGMIVAEALLGHHPLAAPGTREMHEGAVHVALNAMRIPLDGIEDERWRLLCRGLLTRELEDRWGESEVHAWQRGESPPVRERQEPQRTYPPYRLDGLSFATPAALGRALAADWGRGIDLMHRAPARDRTYVRLEEWLETAGAEVPLRVLRQKDPFVGSGNFNRRLFRFIAALDPTIPPGFAGAAVDRAGLAALSHAALTNAGSRSRLMEIQRLGIIGEVGLLPGHQTLREVEERWEADCERLRSLRSLDGIPEGLLPDGEALEIAEARDLLAIVDEAGMAELQEAASAVRKELAEIEWFERLAGQSDDEAQGIPAMIVTLAAAPTARGQLAQVRAERAAREEQERRAQVARYRRRDVFLAFAGLAVSLVGAVPLGLALRPVLGMPDTPVAQLARFAGISRLAPLASLGGGPLLVLAGVLLLVLRQRRVRGAGVALGVAYVLLGAVAFAATPVVDTQMQHAVMATMKKAPICITDGDPVTFDENALRTLLLPTWSCDRLERVTWSRRLWSYDTHGGHLMRLGRNRKVVVLAFVRRQRNVVVGVQARTGEKLWGYECATSEPSAKGFEFWPTRWLAQRVIVTCKSGATRAIRTRDGHYLHRPR